MRVVLVTLGVMLVGLAALSADTDEPPTVEIENPAGGWSSQRIIEVKGSLSDDQITRATLVVNGFARWIDVRAGKFTATIVVSRGNNSLEVVAANKAGQGRDSVNFFSDVPPVDMQVVLSWDTDGTDVDLHVTDPSGEECFYSHRKTAIGGMLDVDDTDGYGPEVFTLAHAASGQYRVEVKYYSSHGHPQTGCRVQVVLFEGTDRERRLEFQKILTKTGDKVEVGLFEVASPEQADSGEAPAAGGK
jgi:uncharacterized protein YfaP (DUF2135 family)